MPFSPRGGSWDQARQSAQLTAPTPLPSLWAPQAPGKNLPQLSPALLHHPSYPQTLVSRHTFTPLAPAVSVRWPTDAVPILQISKLEAPGNELVASPGLF